MEFFNIDDLITDPDLFDLTTSENSFSDAWNVPVFRHSFPHQLSAEEIVPEGFEGQGSKRVRGRTFTCDGRRPICGNCQRSRGYVCRGFLENSRPTEIRDRIRDNFEPATKIRRTDGRSHVAKASTHPPQNQAVLLQEDSPHPDRLQPWMGNHVKSLSKSIPSDSAHDDLLQHYRSIVTGVMMPTIDHMSNPWLHIYLGLALGEVSSKSQSALRHALISVAAYQRGCLQGGSGRGDIHTARLQGQEAEALLQQVANSEEPHAQNLKEKCTAVAAALSLISIDVFSPHGIDCRAHLCLAKRIIQLYQVEQPWKSNAILNMLYQMFIFYKTVASSAQLALHGSLPPAQEQQNSAFSPEEAASSVDEEQEEDDEGDDFEHIANDTHHSHFILNSSFGVSWRTLSLLQQTIKLGSLCATTVSASPELLTRIKELHGHLYSYSEDPSQFLALTSMGPDIRCLANGVLAMDQRAVTSGIMLPKIISDELVENLQWAFHYAVIVYFHRVIPSVYSTDLYNYVSDDPVSTPLTEGTTQHACTRPNHQALIGRIWDRLENMDSITPRDTQLHRGNVLWPAFIAAAESTQVELRHRALIWFAKATKRGVGNIPKAKQVVLEVWRRVDRLDYFEDGHSGLGPVDWRIVMRDLDIFIMLT
ncbi:hypothetical protein ACHAPO_010639 [Fusarium lateritium]